MKSVDPKITWTLYVKLSLVYLVIGVVSAVVFEWLLPKYYIAFYPVIGVFYWLFGMALNFVLSRCCQSRPERLMNNYMLFRMVKLFMTVMFLMFGLLMSKEMRMPFAISLMANYLIYSVVEMYVYYIYNKKIVASVADQKK